MTLPDQTIRSYPLNPKEPATSIGRQGCDITLDHPQVSRFHAWLAPTPDGWHILRDVTSANGTFVNSQRITEQGLHPGDIIHIGPFRLVYTATSLDLHHQPGLFRLDVHTIVRDVAVGTQTRRILHPVSLCIEPGTFVALVGGSGSGKSTLLKALSGYEPATSGQVLLNGDDLYHHFNLYRAALGYLPQSDILHETLPVDHALAYIARLGLPADTGDSEIRQRIDQVLEEVEMTEQRHMPIHQLSGGQRKRVGMAAELLSDPRVLFLDEPTSGLDPGLEYKMMTTLRRLADSGRTIVLVTHATENIMQCDQVVFLSDGYVVYAGPPADALEFFGIPGGNFADIYTRLSGIADPDGMVVQYDLSAEYAAWQRANLDSNAYAASPASPPLLAQLWHAKYSRSSFYQRYVASRLHHAAPVSPQPRLARLDRHLPHGAKRRQIGILLQRAVDLLWHDRSTLLLLLLQVPLIALLINLIAPADVLNGVQSVGLVQRAELKKFLLMLVTATLWFGINNAAREITRESTIIRHERLSGLRISAYLGSKIILLGTLSLLQTVLLVAGLGLGLQLPQTPGLLLPLVPEIFVTLLLTSLAGMALGLLISVVAVTPDQAIRIVPVVLVLHMLFAGQIFPLHTWLTQQSSWFAVSRWTIDGLGSSINLNLFCDLPNLAYHDSGRPPLACGLGALRYRPDTSLPAAFTYTREHLLLTWSMLLVHIGIGLGSTAALLAWKDQLFRRIFGTGEIPRILLLRWHRRNTPATASPPTTNQLPTRQALVPSRSTSPDRLFDSTVLRLSSPPPASSNPEITLPLVVAAPGKAEAGLEPAPPAASSRFSPPLDNQHVSTGVPGSAIGRYQIEEKLGTRGMFTVYRAYDPLMQRLVAIKLLQPQFCNPHLNANFQQEAGLIATLEHPCVVRVYDFGEIHGQPFLVMQYLRGGTLVTRMTPGPLPLNDLVPMIERVAAALDEAHARSILHRNLKPTNILFNQEGEACLADFALNLLPEITHDLSSQGVLDAHYLSPEHVHLVLTPGNVPSGVTAELTPCSDIYALGAIVFHALTGYPPYHADTPEQIALAHLTMPIPQITSRNSALPDIYQTVIERALAKDPAQRYATAGALAAELKQMSSGHWLPSPSINRRDSHDGESPLGFNRQAVVLSLPSDAQSPSGNQVPFGRPSPPALNRPRRSIVGTGTEHIGRYVLEQVLGRGGMAVVYLAYDPTMQRRIAVKILSPRFNTTPEFLSRFREEAALVAALEHECIVQVYDLGEHEGQPFIVMQYLPGGTLAQRLTAGAMSLPDTAPIIERVARGLEVAHQRGIAHQDIKPANILFDERSQAYLSDFGIAVASQAGTPLAPQRIIGGTPHYMSPEQARVLLDPDIPDAVATQRSDIYALGVVLFQMLTGQLPYTGSTVTEIVQAHLTAPIPAINSLNPALSVALQSILERALAKDPAQRYTHASDLAYEVCSLVQVSGQGGSEGLQRT